MAYIGLISDTHCLFDEALKSFLKPVDEIWHAGDFGNIETVDAIANGFNLDLKAMDTETARRHLMKLTGVGRKVADCILLFGYHRTDVFPVDVWTERVHDDLFGKSDISPEAKANRLCSHFGQLSGYAQQYLYYYYRENKIK